MAPLNGLDVQVLPEPVAGHSRRFGLRQALRVIRMNSVGLPPESLRKVLVAAVFLDLSAAALVVPLLPVKLRALGVSQRMNGLMGSMFSMSQIVGGLALGTLSDRHLGRRGLLLLSFVGAGISYAIVGLPNVSLPLLMFSRVVVGLVKQSLTASIAMMTELTVPGSERTFWIGRISSVMQLAWITGQASGGFLNRLGTSTPAIVAVTMYVINFALVRLLLPPAGSAPIEDQSRAQPHGTPSKSVLGMFASLASPTVARVVAVNLASQCVLRVSFTTRMLYELDRWSLTPVDIGMLASYKSLVGVFISWQVVGALSRRYGGQVLLRGAGCASLLAYLLEALPADRLRQIGGSGWSSIGACIPAKLASDPSLLLFALVCYPMNAAATQIISIALKSRFTEVVPQENTASALAALDVLQSIVGVIAPVLSGFFFDGLSPTSVPLRYAALEAIVLCMIFCVFPAPSAKVPVHSESLTKSS